MAPVSKDTLEVANPAAGTPVSQSGAPASSSSSLSQSEVVSLEVPVKVHGSRVTQVAGAVTPSTEPFEEQTQTMIVFPDGAVVKLRAAVNAGQMLVLTNLKTRQDAICRVRKVRPNPNLANYVEVEFTHRQPGYWGVSFPSDTSAEAKKSVAPAAPAELKPKSAAPTEISWAPAPPAANPEPPSPAPQIIAPPPAVKAPASSTPSKSSAPAVPKQEPAFISIGTQEEVQPPAAETAATKPGKLLESEIEKLVAPSSRTEPSFELPRAAQPINPEEVALSDLQGDAKADAPALFSAVSTAPMEAEPATVAPRAAPASSSKIFGRFAGSTSLESVARGQETDSAAQPEFSGAVSASKIPASGQNWTLIAAGVAVLLAGLAGGIYYVRSHANTSGNDPKVASVAQTAPIGAQKQGFEAAVQPGPATSVDSSAAGIPAGSAPVVAVPSKSAAPAAVQQSQPVQVVAPSAAKAVAPSVTSNMMAGALNAHPTAPARGAEDSSDEPSVTSHPDYSASNGLANADILSSTNAHAIPEPTIQPEVPIHVGGHVQEPKLTASAMPVYPQSAKNAGIMGDVVIETTIDKDGNVSATRVVSGPAVLRQSALDALRKWKYEPSKLDGQPISVQMTVTIKFRK